MLAFCCDTHDIRRRVACEHCAQRPCQRCSLLAAAVLLLVARESGSRAPAASARVRVVGDEVCAAADEQVQAHDVPEEEEARVPVGKEERGEVEYELLGGVELVDALHALLSNVI